MAELLCKEEVYALIGAAMQVYNELGQGFFKPIYQEAIEMELAARRVPFEARKEIRVFYKGARLRSFYVADLVVFGQVVVELKALDRLTSREESQLLNSLKATGLEVGVLINFGAPGKLEWKRMVRTRA